jgi:SP family general alpha glucoside:H+ symporter-like MFS transporter
MVFAFVVLYLFNADQANLGGKIGFIFFGFCTLSFVLSWLEIPETKGKIYPELDYLFEIMEKTRRFTEPLSLRS